MFGFSQFKEILQGKIGTFHATDVLVEEKLRSWGSFCSSRAPESKYVGRSRIPGISRLKVKSQAKMALFRTKIFRDEEQH